MAGHNKWSKVKHIKARVDAKKGKMFSKLAHEIFISAREGGGDPSLNPRLRQAIDASKSQSMPKENIERAIKKGTGELDGGAIEEVTYEGYGPDGTAFLVEIATDNKNRSAADIRNIFNKNGGNMGTSGSVAHLFNRVGEIRLSADSVGEDEALEEALEAGADDVYREEDEHVVVTPPDQLGAAATQLREKELPVRSQELLFLPISPVEIPDSAAARQVLRLFDALEDYQDTLNVFSNFDISEEALELVEAG